MKLRIFEKEKEMRVFLLCDNELDEECFNEAFGAVVVPDAWDGDYLEWLDDDYRDVSHIYELFDDGSVALAAGREEPKDLLDEAFEVEWEE